VTPQFEPPSDLDGGSVDQFPTVEMPVDTDGLPLKRFDQIADDGYGDPTLWADVAAYNGVDDPLDVPEGTTIVLPSLAILLEVRA
jgi:hypothetical protein